MIMEIDPSRMLGAEKSTTHIILNALPNGVLVTNNQGQVVLVNPAFHHQMALPENLSAGLELKTYIRDKELCRQILELAQSCQADADDLPPYELTIGTDKFLQARGRPIVGENGRCLGAVVLLQDITAMKVIDRLKNEFVAKVSHEMRSPLCTIHEQIAAVLSEMVGHLSDTEAHLLSRAKEKTQGLISLIGDLLDISRIESGAICQEIKPIMLDEFLENIIDFLHPQAAAKRQNLFLKQPRTALPALFADPLALESIFGNLITNAINYTPDEGRIQVEVDMAGSNIQVQISDNGLGIGPHHLGKIFDRFYRVKTEQTRYITGTGLGLPIVKGLVDSLGGRINVKSIPDEGTTFTVLLPINA